MAGRLAARQGPTGGRPLDVAYAPFTRAVGDALGATVEAHENPERIDHVWITMNVGLPARLLVSISTSSKRSRDAGFDPRVRVARLRSRWESLPPLGWEKFPSLDYQALEKDANVFYEHLDRPPLENMLVSRASQAVRLEVWGTPYHRKTQPGIHQIHSRRASSAVAEDMYGRDGALRFYFAADQVAELFLFKFCGQP